MLKKIAICLALVLCQHIMSGQTRKIVPDQYATIQAAVDAATHGDTVLVKPGVYHGAIDFKGKEILVTSLFRLTSDTSYITNTIVTPDPAISTFANSRAAWFKNGETSKTELSGFTIKDFRTDCCGEGIIEIVSATPRLSYLRLNNILGTGANAITVNGVHTSRPIILEGVEIKNSEIPINSDSASVTLLNCSITNNGGGLHIQHGGELVLINSLIDDNHIFGGLNFSGRKLIFFNSIARTSIPYHGNIPPSVSVSADSLIIRNGIVNSIEILNANFIDTTGFVVNTNPMYSYVSIRVLGFE